MKSVFLFPLVLCLLTIYPENNKPTSFQKLRFEESIMVDGRIRTYTVVVPLDYYRGKTFPLVIALHGGGGSATQLERNTGWSTKARKEGFIVVYPNGTGRIKTWNAGDCCGAAMRDQVDDVKFISRMIDRLITEHKVDSKRIYATGMSNGGMMCYRLACELGNRIAAIAPVASVMVQHDCKPVHPIPILHIHSALDQNVPVKGGLGKGPSQTDYPPLDSTLVFWAKENGCNANRTLLESTELYNHYTWSGCGDYPVELYLTKDGGHSWPGAVTHRTGGDAPSKAFNADDLIWSFFKRFQLNQ